MNKKSLTAVLNSFNLTMHSQKTSAGIGTPIEKGALSAPAQVALFLCPKFMLWRAVLGYLWVGRFLFRGSSNPTQPTTHNLELVRGGLQFERGSHYALHIQYPSSEYSATPQTFPSLFSVAHHALQADFAQLDPASYFNAGGIA